MYCIRSTSTLQLPYVPYVQYKQYIFLGARGIGFFLIRVSENYLCRKSLREKGMDTRSFRNLVGGLKIDQNSTNSST